MNKDRTWDVVTLGEPLLRLAPPLCGQLRRATTLDAVVAGSQLNVAANLARLGLRTALVTSLPDHALGQLAHDAICGYGIDPSLVRTIPGGKLGVTYVEFSAAPRAPQAVYDRAGSAASQIGPADFDWPQIAGRSRALYTDGIFPGLGKNCLQAAAAFLQAGKEAGCITCFDVNYREHLWTPEEARRAWRRLLPLADLLVTNGDVSKRVFGFEGNAAEVMQRYAVEFGCRVICWTSRQQQGLSRGSWHSQAWDGALHDSRRQEFEIVDRYGTGDAWTAGFLYATLQQPGEVSAALDFANALCALAHAIPGDVAHVTVAEVQAVVAGEEVRLRR